MLRRSHLGPWIVVLDRVLYLDVSNVIYSRSSWDFSDSVYAAIDTPVYDHIGIAERVRPFIKRGCKVPRRSYFLPSGNLATTARYIGLHHVVDWPCRDQILNGISAPVRNRVYLPWYVLDSMRGV